MAPQLARADRRSFGYTYEYATLPEGQTEVEVWHTQTRDTWDATSAQRFEEKIEFEYGVTDRYDLSMYTVFAESTDENLHLDAVRIENRYRFADRGEWPVDTIAYVELAKDFGASIYEIEGKAIVSRNFDNLLVAANAIGEVAFGNNVPHRDLSLGWSVGASYELHPKLRLGVESWGASEDNEDGNGRTLRAAIGPAISVAPSSKLWVAGTAGFGIASTFESDDFAGAAFSARVVIGMEM
jgi:hypothetical protein